MPKGKDTYGSKLGRPSKQAMKKVLSKKPTKKK